MTPKEKAEQLINAFIPYVRWKMGQEDVLKRAKDCALIAVDEIKEQLLTNLSNDVSAIHAIYWEKVKQELRDKELVDKKQTPESTADYLDRHMIEAMKELAKEGFNPNKKQTMKQTAVEWLLENIAYIPMGFEIDIIKQAKAMEKEQIVDACNQNEFEDIDGLGIHETITKGEQYYNETYNK
jgi:hypothetical protein